MVGGGVKGMDSFLKNYTGELHDLKGIQFKNSGALGLWNFDILGFYSLNFWNLNIWDSSLLTFSHLVAMYSPPYPFLVPVHHLCPTPHPDTLSAPHSTVTSRQSVCGVPGRHQHFMDPHHPKLQQRAAV